MKLGDIVASVAQPIGSVLDWTIGPDGIGFYKTPIEGCGGCKQRQQRLNDFGDWLTNNKGENENMEKQDYILQVVVPQATGLKDACDRMSEGIILSGAPKAKVQIGGGGPARPSTPGQTIVQGSASIPRPPV